MILGLDLSSSSTGFGILDKEGKAIEYGQIRPSATQSHGAKYTFIANKVRDLIDEFGVKEVVLERYFVGGFKTQGTFICAELRGCVKMIIAQEFPEVTIVEEIFPSSLKKIVTGNGKATKQEVGEAILQKLSILYSNPKGTGKSKFTFNIGEDKYYDDTTDALSLAYCHYIKGVPNEFI